MQAGHHGPDWNVENLGRIGVAEIADVDEHDDITEVMGHRGESLGHVVLLETGRVVASGSPQQVAGDAAVRRAYLGM